MIAHRQISTVTLGAVLALGMVAPAAATSSAKDSGRDAAIFRAGVLTANDLPEGFTSHGPGQAAHRPGTSGYANPLPACRKVYPGLGQSARVALQASSDDFVNQATGAESYGTVRVYKDANTAGTYVGLLSSSEFLRCFRAVEQEQATRDSTGSSKESNVVSKLPKLAGLGDQETGLRNVVTTLAGGAPSDVFAIDYYYVRVGRAVVYLVFGNPQKPLPQGVQAVRTVVTRVSRAEK